MDYSPQRIISVIINYIERKVNLRIKNINNITYESKIIDLSNSKVDRITDNIEDNEIISILGNNFYETDVKNFHTVLELLSLDDDYILTDGGIPKKSFKYFYGISNNKFLCDELNNLPLDMYCYPVRNLKHIHGRIVEAFLNDNKYIVFKDEFGNVINLYDECMTVKSLFVGGKKQFLLITNTHFDNTKLIEPLNMFLKEDPCYYIQIDNGRYSSYQIEYINKKKYMEQSFESYSDLFVFGEIK